MPDDLDEDKLQREYDNLKWLHVYAQYAHHSPVMIEGTRNALEELRNTIDRALATGMEATSESVYTTDGEGYGITINIRNHEYLEKQTLPYYATYAGGVGAQLHQQENEMQEKIDDANKINEEARKLYVAYTDNHPTIHSNRFPSWGEISHEERETWRNKVTKPGEDNVV